MRNVLLVALLLLAGCGGDDVTESPDSSLRVDSGSVAVDAGSGSDSGVRVDAGAGTDAGAGLDAGPTGTDAGSSSDSGVSTSDAGASMCLPGSTIADMKAGVCDGRGRMLCAMWAEMYGGVGAVAQCLPPMGRCARADACDSVGTCTCGAGPECADDHMCVARPGGGFACECIVP